MYLKKVAKFCQNVNCTSVAKELDAADIADV